MSISPINPNGIGRVTAQHERATTPSSFATSVAGEQIQTAAVEPNGRFQPFAIMAILSVNSIFWVSAGIAIGMWIGR